MPSLLLRAPADADPRTGGTTAAITKAVRGRVQLAEAARWGDLLEQAAADELAAAQAVPENDLQQAAVGERAAQLRRAQAAVTKARSGNLRGALQVLTGEGVADGTEETVRKLQELVMTEPAEADTGGELEEQLRLARETLDRRGPPRLHMRALRRRTRALRPGAAAGASGWRNSHVEIGVHLP